MLKASVEPTINVRLSGHNRHPEFTASRLLMTDTVAKVSKCWAVIFSG
jgi:hypothetical protein